MWMFKPPTTTPSLAIKEFVLIPQHTAPANTTKELGALYDVLQDVKKMWKTEVEAELQLEHQGLLVRNLHVSPYICRM